MLGIDLDFLCHRHTMDERVKPIAQRRRKFNEDKCLIIREETRKLLVVVHIREIKYPKCLVYLVLVKKANEKWRMCVDFTDLNKACPLWSIRMHRKDKSKTTFMVDSPATATRS